MVHKNDYNEVVFEKVINSLKEVKRVTRTNFMCDLNNTFSKFYTPALKEITNVLIKYKEIPMSYDESTTLWFDDGELGTTPYFIIKAHNSHYNEKKAYSCNTWQKEVKEACANEIADILSYMVHLIEKDLEKAKSLPKAEELNNTFLSYIKKYINNEKYNADIEEGKLAKEMCKDYTAFVVRRKDTNCYKCCFRFYNDLIGNIVIVANNPYYGEYSGHFTMDEVEEGIKDCLRMFKVA